jgi:truncated hemoglobin YjbI
MGIGVFETVGPEAASHLIQLLKHGSPSVRRAAAQALGSFGGQSEYSAQAVLVLTEALKDKDLGVRQHAIWGLEKMGVAASNSVPALAQFLTGPITGKYGHSYLRLRLSAAYTLGKIGPAARSALPALKSNLGINQECKDTLANWVAGGCAVAIWRIDSDADTAVPVLLQELPQNDEYGKCEWLQTLGEMGPRAKAALPHLVETLRVERRDWVLECVTNTLKAIDPEAAASAGVK